MRETQIESLLSSLINLTLTEIWTHHPWTFKRRKTTFSTVTSQETYNLDEEVDEIHLIRQDTSPMRLLYVPDDLFYRHIPNPESLGTGTPRIYRRWEETSFSAQNTVAEALQVLSSSAADTAALATKVIIVGRESTNNLIVAESFTLNGTTTVAGTTTWAIGGLQLASKSTRTTGTITVRGATSGTTFALLSPEETSPRFRRIGLYPIPSAAITMYMEYDERLRQLVNDADVPQMDPKWNWVLIEGVLAKVWEYKQNEQASVMHTRLYQDGLKTMKAEDLRNMDYIPVLERRIVSNSTIRRYSDSENDNAPQYAVGW